MISADLPRRLIRLAPFLIPMLVIGCAAGPRPPAVDAAAAKCARAQADFDAAAQFYAGDENFETPDTAVSAGELNAEAQTAEKALADLSRTFGNVAACGPAAASTDRALTVLAVNLDTARTSLAGAARVEASLKDRLRQLTVLDSVAARRSEPPVPRPEIDAFLAIDAGEIFTRPTEASVSIASLRPGQRVTVPRTTVDNGPAASWYEIDLNDGSVGYVRASLLQRAPVMSAAFDRPAKQLPDGLVLATRVILHDLPQERTATGAMISAVAEKATRPTTPAASSDAAPAD